MTVQSSARWLLSDATVVELGGKVQGDSAFAESLRTSLARGYVQVTIWAHPGGRVDLDVNDPALMNAWLDAGVAWWRRVRKLDIRIVKRPDNIPPLPPPPWAGQPPAPPGTVH